MNRTISVARMHMGDKMSWYFVPAIVLLSSFLVNYGIAWFVDEPMYTGAVAAIPITAFTFGLIVLSQTFPFALGLSISRTHYFFGTVLVAALFSAEVAILFTLLSFVEGELWVGWGVDLHYFNLPYLNEGGWLGQLWVFFAGVLHLYIFSLCISSVHRRFGRLGMYVLTLVVFLLGTIGSFLMTYNDLWVDLLRAMGSLSAVEYASWASVLTVVYGLLSFAMLRRSAA